MRNFKKVISLVMITMMALLMFTGCGSKTVTMKDMEGTEFTVPKKIERIVSTAPSNTEILVGLGLGDKIVGVDKYSSDVKGLNSDIPKIDFRNPDAETIVALKPDVIIASGHNREGKEDPFKALKDAGIPVVYIPTSDSIDGIYEDINFLAKLTGTEAEGKKMVDSMKSEVDKIKTKLEQNKLIDKLINMFIRLHLFMPIGNLNLDDKIYLDYMKFLYYWNKGERKKLANLYSDVKVAIYNWNGEASDGRINISIGKNQMRYKISQRLSLSADLSNIKVNESQELLKFNPSLIIGYKNEDKNTSYKIDMDFNLYELLMRIKDGYRPNKNDKYNYINFVEFVNKIQKLGSQNKEVYIEDKEGLGTSNYRLVYNQEFEVFEFKSTNEV